MPPTPSANRWVDEFCNRRGHELFCRIPDDYLCDSFNYAQLDEHIDHLQAAWNLITGNRIRRQLQLIIDCAHLQSTSSLLLLPEIVQLAAEKLYGMLHARFVLSSDGCALVKERMLAVHYGTCRRVHCDGAPLVPCGLSDQLKHGTVKFYCGRCDDVFEPQHQRHRKLDGAYFGTSLPHMLYMMYPRFRDSSAVVASAPPPKPTVVGANAMK